MSDELFISYNHSDGTSKSATDIANRLKEMGLNVWIDQDEIKPGQSITESINQALQRSAYVIALVGPNDRQSKWAKKELELAIEQGKDIIPILVDYAKPEDLPESIADRLAIDVSQDLKNLDSIYKTIDSRRSIWARLREYLVND